MPLVFVHGVSNRDSPEFRENRIARDAFFRRLVLPALGLDGAKVKIFNPYWGGDAVKFRWNNASLPETSDDIETFGSADDLDAQIAADIIGTAAPGSRDLVAIARQSLPEAIDIVWSASMATAPTDESATALAETYAGAMAYARDKPDLRWLQSATMGNFVDLLFHEVANHVPGKMPGVAARVEWESFGSAGVAERLRENLQRIFSLGGDAFSSALRRLGRRKVHLGVSLFVGDILEYLNTRETKDGQPGKIVANVLREFRLAKEAIHPRDDPRLIIVAHSLGGVITYDLLTHFDPSFEVDDLVTVGSQVALFEEMTLYKNSRRDTPSNPPGDRLPRPPNIKRWLNVLDYNDIFSFRAEGVFTGVSDFKFDTGFGLLKAHSGYFQRARFYDRLGERLSQA